MEILTNGSGSSIGKGGQRTTRDVRRYTWKGKGLKVTDVPGIAAFEGAEDEELAFKAAEQSDLVLFLITDDAPQPAEAECLARVRSLGKPVVGICNVKVALNDADDIVLFLQEKWFDPQRLGALIEQFHEFANKYTLGSQIYFIYTHLRSRFLSRQPEYKPHQRRLERTSRFNLVEKQIISEVIGHGIFLRWKNFIDGATAPMLQFSDCLLDFSAKNSSNGRILIDKRRRVMSWANQFRSSGQERIDTFIAKQMNSLRNAIPAFVEENYERSDAGDHWKRLIERQGVERKAKQLVKEIQEECRIELLDIAREIAAELNLIGKLSADRRISMDAIFDTKRAWNWGTAILAGSLTIAAIFTGVVAGVAAGFIGGFLSRWFEDRESKARKQREKLAGKLRRDVDKIERNLREELDDWFHQDLLKKQVYVLREELNVATSAVLKLADTQRNFALELIHRCLERGQNLLQRAAGTLQNAPSDKVRELARRLPSTVAPASEPLRIVFAGQYSAGKSSLLKVLTNREDIEIGAGITTQQVQQFNWNGIEIIDTPGVHTELRSDHDALTYEAISSADLLVFVITNELFDSHLADHFRKLAIERDKAHEMLLVVNKMQRCAQGNTPVARDVIREDIRKVLVPFTPEELRTSFVDAELALDARMEQDEEVSKVYQRKSGFDNFLDTLNAFVTEKQLAVRYTTSLYTLEQVLQEALAAEPSDDTDVDALEELLLQQRRALVDTRVQLPRAVESQVQRTTDKIQQEGRKVADLIHGGLDPKTIDRELKAAQGRVQEDTDTLSERIQKTVEEHMSALAERVNQIAQSELAKELFPRLAKRVEA